MKRRHKMGKHHSRKHFSRHAAKTHVKNMPRTGRTINRGGIRL